MEKDTKQFLLNKYAEKFLKENKQLLQDYGELCNKLIMFRFKWGIEIGIIFKNSKEIKGRELGIGIVEELFNNETCPICLGIGEVSVNGTDEQGRIMRGVDTEKCECQIREPEDFSGASEGDR